MRGFSTRSMETWQRTIPLKTKGEQRFFGNPEFDKDDDPLRTRDTNPCAAGDRQRANKGDVHELSRNSANINRHTLVDDERQFIVDSGASMHIISRDKMSVTERSLS